MAGRADPLSMAVLQIYAVALIANTPGNVLVLMLIAQGRHGIIGTLVLVEACMNLALSIVLSHIMGPMGVAVSSLTLFALDGLLVVPLVA